jgi:hypothetical protein
MAVGNSHIVLMTPNQEKRLRDWKGTLQTDALEGLLLEDNSIVTMTSGFDETLKRWRPLLISIAFGKTEQHYKPHFNQLFSLLPMKLDKGVLQFLGATQDFSTAQRNAYVNELSQAIQRENRDVSPDGRATCD